MRQINQPLKDQCERLLSSVLNRGDKLKLAKGLGVTLSEVSQQCNPEEARISDYYRFKEFLNQLCAVNREAARVLAADIQATVAECSEARAESDMAKLTGGLEKEWHELIFSFLSNMPAHNSAQRVPGHPQRR